MAARKTKIETEEPKAKWELTDNQRWVYGFMLLFFSLFLLLAVVSYYFTWADDQNIVRWGSLWAREAGEVSNLAGKLGALLADSLVGDWFGVFGVVVPLVLVILSLRIMRYRPMFLRRSVRISLITMILGSLTLGLVFKDKWAVFGSGLGGAHGIYISAWLVGFIGMVGAGLLLLLSWVLLAVYLNRNTISVVNKFGKSLGDTSKKVGQGAADLIKKGAEPVAAAKPKKESKQQSQPEPQSLTPEVEAEGPELLIETNDEPEIAEGGIEIELPPAEFIADGTFEITDMLKTVEEAGMPMGIEPGVIDPWGVDSGRQARGVKRPAQIAPSDEFEVVDMTADREEEAAPVEGALVEAGAVIDEMEVLIAAQKDVELEDEEIENTLYDPTLELSKYQKPPVEILEDHSVEVVVTEEEVRENKDQIVRTLDNFGIKIEKIKATIGPTVTLYEIVPAPGVRISKIKNLEDDIALSLSALGIRIIAPIPGKGTIGIEVPNKDKKIVSMYSMVKSQKFQDSTFDLPVVLGKTIQNETFVIDLAKMPHLLVAGATGQGKSVGLNAIITSLLYRKHPAELKFVLVDPKKVELTLYKKLENHFLAKMPGDDDTIITDTHKVIYTLNSLCVEMDQRYNLLQKAEVRHIKEYNDKFTHRRLNPNNGHRYLPYIVVIIDEFADMIMTAGREIETPIARLAQLARAVGIHLVIATQRPTTNIITGVIKANFPARIAFRVTSMIDSRTIIDQPGANQLIGRGDMLVSTGSELIRVQCAFVDTPEIERVMDHIGNQKGFPEPYELPEYSPDGDTGSKNVDMGQIDSMFADVARFIVQNQQGSTSSIQRRFSIGYNRAGRIMDQIEAAGIVGKAEGSKPREVLITDMNTLESIITVYVM